VLGMEKQQLQSWNDRIIAEFRANKGKVGGDFEGSSMLLLHTMGARTGKERVNPLVFSRDGDRYVIIASYAGAPRNPDWYYNIQAQRDVTVEMGTERFRARASIAEGEERQRLFDQQAAEMPIFNDYQTRTKRQIPVVILERLQNC
jgi:deazaflavin-dependent oxidoreductase (nitroreductase family)